MGRNFGGFGVAGVGGFVCGVRERSLTFEALKPGGKGKSTKFCHLAESLFLRISDFVINFTCGCAELVD